MSLDPACACGNCPDCGDTTLAKSGPLAASNWRHSAIRWRLLGRIGQAARGNMLPLAQLSTRATDDPAIAVIDAYAGSLHVLAWNAAQLADDATLPRSQDRQALLDLVGLVGYRPRPALSATAWLAYTLDEFPGAPAEVTIAAGNPVASLPHQGKLSVTFETDAELVARPEWNRMAAVQDRARASIDEKSTSVEIAGQSLPLKPGDRILLALDRPEGKWLGATITKLSTPTDGEARTVVELSGLVTLGGAKPLDADKGQLILLGVHTAAFGANAPNAQMLLKPDGGRLVPLVGGIDANTQDWSGLVMDPPNGPAGRSVDLDGVRTDALPNRLMLFDAGDQGQAVRISAATESNRAGFGLSGKVTHVTFVGLPEQNPFNNKVRATPILLETLRLPLFAGSVIADLPSEQNPDSLLVEGAVALPAGRHVMLSGAALVDPATERPVPWAEALVVKACTPAGSSPPRTRISFTTAPLARYRAGTLFLLGNVVSASHGSSTPGNLPELLGSGDARQLNPRFTLSRAPLTQLPVPTTALTPSGYAPALEVRVGGRHHQVVSSLFGLAEGARAYVVETGRDGKQALRFAGRLPTATNSITASYRVGAGAEGNVAAGRLSIALAPVPGVRQVSNPAPADGGSDAETLEAIRTSAPAALRNFDRVVSLVDHAAFAGQFRGVGKAEAHALRGGMRHLVVITIAGTSGNQPSADLMAGLTAAIRSLSPPGHGVRVQGFVPINPDIDLALAIDQSFLRADVELAVCAALANRCGAAQRSFAQGLASSTVLATVHVVPGVLGARLTRFQRSANQAANLGRLSAAGPSVSLDPITRAPKFGLAEWLWIDPSRITLTEMQP
jgi:hypothetical protein